MKINCNSWHYKYVASMWDSRPRSLCWYFWKVILTVLLLHIGGGVLAVAAAIVVGYLLAIPVTGWFIHVDSFPAFVSAFAWLLIWATAQYQYRQYLYLSGRLKWPGTKPRKEPGLLSQYIEAKHRKICPLLEYEWR